MTRAITIAALLALLAAPVAAQTGGPTTIQAIDLSTGATVTRVGDATNNSIRLTCIVCPVTQSGTWTVQPGNTANTTAWLVTGTGGTFPATQSGIWDIRHITGTISLPTGAATAAKQPALGTAGSASSDVLTIQGIASMTAVKVDGSGVTQPVSGTVTANLSSLNGAATAVNQSTEITSLASIDGKITAVNTGAVVVSSSALPSGAATSTKQSDGSQKTQVVDGSGNVIGAHSNALDVSIRSQAAALTVDGSGVTQPVSGTITANAGSGSFTVAQATATNLKAQAEVYQGGTAVGAAAPLQVTLANGSVPSHAVTNAGTFATQAAQSGTWTVQPGNTANTTAWLVTTRTALTANAPTAATVGASSAQALASNSSRKGLILVNTSANTISIGCGQTAVLNSGITLYPGGSYAMTEYDFCTGAINAIASSASSNLAIQEYQ